MQVRNIIAEPKELIEYKGNISSKRFLSIILGIIQNLIKSSTLEYNTQEYSDMLPLWDYHLHGICPHCHEPSCMYACLHNTTLWGFRCGSCDTFVKIEEMTTLNFGPCPKYVTSPYIANRKSKEVHTRGCVWASRIADHNRLECFPFGAGYLIKEREYNGCYYCLPEYDTDKHEVTQESMNEIYAHLRTIPTGIDFAKWESSEDVQGLMWEMQPGLIYFDMNKPTIIWIHGWSDSMMPDYYTRFLYKNEFLSKGYNVGIFRYQKDIIDCIYEMWYINSPEDIPTNEWWGVWRRCFNVVECPSREYVVDKVWRNGGAGAKLRKALEDFFGQIALAGYNKEVTLLAHSTGAQVTTLGLKSFYENTNALSNLILTLVFVDPWIPPKGYVTYPGVCAEWAVPIYYGAYSPYIASKILSSFSNKPNNNFIFCPLTEIPGKSSKAVLRTHLSYVFDKATFF